MFGYIRPHTAELRVRELERFRALYCGMCRALGKRYGYAARFVLSYDFVFLAALLWEPEDAVVIRACRCPASLRRKRCVLATEGCGNPIERAAGLGVILAYHKLRDNAADEGFLKATAARAAMLGLRGAYKKAASELPQLDTAVREHLAALDAAEAASNASLDELADKFAQLLADCGALAKLVETDTTNDARTRALRMVLYHVGRWIYLADARDDLAEDTRLGRANALTGRSELAEKGEPDAALALTMTHSVNLAVSAFELLDETPWSDIVRNILCLGVPQVQAQIFGGTWQRRRGRERRI